MEPVPTAHDASYSIEQTIAASGIVVGMAVGTVAFVAAPVVVATMIVGTTIGFVAARVTHTRWGRMTGRPVRNVEPVR